MEQRLLFLPPRADTGEEGPRDPLCTTGGDEEGDVEHRLLFLPCTGLHDEEGEESVSEVEYDSSLSVK